MRREVGDDGGFSRERRGEGRDQPGAVAGAERDRVLRREGEGAVADQLKIWIQLAYAFDHGGAFFLRRKRVIGPQGAPEKANTVEDGSAAIEELDRALARRRSHGLLHRFELALVILVVAGEIEHGLAKSFSGPLDSGGAVVDVPREHDHVGVAWRRHEGREFQVKVGIDSDAHVKAKGITGFYSREAPESVMIARLRAKRGAGKRLAGPYDSRRFHGQMGTRRRSGTGILRKARRLQRPRCLWQHVRRPGGVLHSARS